MSIRLILGVVLTMMMASCFLDSDDDLTIVTGKVRNKIDGTNVSGIAIDLLKCDSRFNFYGSICDSLMTVHTDSDGNYKLSFRTERKHYYEIGVAGGLNYEGSIEKVIVKEGKSNNVDFELMPYRTLKVNLKTNKGNKNYLQIDFVRAQCSGGWLGWSGGTIFLDTFSVNQSIDTVQYLGVTPFCDYRFIKNLCNRTGIDFDYKYTGCSDYETMQIFSVDYSDTTEIELN